MVVLSGAICTKSGKALIARQFVEMTRIRIEGLLAAFPKLLGSDNKQHTYVETESVRYLYQPMENLYLLLITNRASNVVEDLETLRLLSKVVPDIAGAVNTLTEERISEKCFDLIFAFDEVITAGGYREPITLPQIRTNMDMESHEEKLHNMIKISKQESAREQARDAAKSIRERQKEQQRLGLGSGMTGIGGGDPSSAPPEGDLTPNIIEISDHGSQYGAPEPMETSNSKASIKPKKGMSLMSKGGKNKSLEDSVFKEDKLAPVAITAKQTAAGSQEAAAPVPVVQLPQHPIMLVVAEKVSARMTRDGMIDSFEVKGSLTLTARDDESAKCAVQLKVGNAGDFVFNTHPKVNKPLYDKSLCLQLKDTSKGFPSERPVGILRWSYASNNDDLVPLKINCWPEEESRGHMNVSIEYTLEKGMDLHDVRIRIPLGTSEQPGILSVDGTHKYNAAQGELIWELQLIDQSNASGSLEFSIAQKDTDAFFPITVDFSSQSLFVDVEVAGVTSVGSGGPLQYGFNKGMAAEEYFIE